MHCLVLNNADWKINERTIVKPDLMIVCGEVDTDFLEMPPVLILEVLSPSTRPNDRTTKFELYRIHGVKYYLMADYDLRRAEVYDLINNAYQEIRKSNFLLNEDCEISFEFDKWWS